MIFNWPCTHTHTHALPSSVDPGALLALYLQTVRWLYRSCMAAPITKHDKWGRPLSHYLYGNHCAADKRTAALDCYWHHLCHASPLYMQVPPSCGEERPAEMDIFRLTGSWPMLLFCVFIFTLISTFFVHNIYAIISNDRKQFLDSFDLNENVYFKESAAVGVLLIPDQAESPGLGRAREANKRTPWWDYADDEIDRFYPPFFWRTYNH